MASIEEFVLPPAAFVQASIEVFDSELKSGDSVAVGTPGQEGQDKQELDEERVKQVVGLVAVVVAAAPSL